jgi:hypothetical protein
MKRSLVRTTLEAGAIEVRFVLPKGAYATTVLSNALLATDADTRSTTGPEARQRKNDRASEERDGGIGGRWVLILMLV